MGRKGNLAIFESSGNSKTRETTPTKIGVHACYIKAYLHIYFETILIQLYFLMTMDYSSPWVQKGNLAVFESIGISETGEAMPTKIGVHVCYIKAYLHKFFELIQID